MTSSNQDLSNKYQKRILIVEDELAIAELFQVFLKKSGYESSIASTCDKALNALRKLQYDGMLLDMYLPDGNGLDCVPAFKEINPTLHVIVLTGSGYDDVMMDTARRYGVVGYFSKNEIVTNFKKITDCFE